MLVSSQQHDKKTSCKFLSSCLFLILAATYLLIPRLIWGRVFFAANSSYDWYGTDIDRHLMWMQNLRFSTRFQYHPLSFLYYKTYGIILKTFHIMPMGYPVPYVAVPTMLFTVWGIVASASLLAPKSNKRGGFIILTCAALVFVSSTLNFAWITESHTIGGVFVLISATYAYKALSLESDEGRQQEYHKYVRLCLMLSIIGGGITLSNFLTTVTFVVMLKSSRLYALEFFLGTKLRVLLTISLLTVSVATFFVVYRKLAHSSEYSFFVRPSLHWAGESLRVVILSLFGLPRMQIKQSYNSNHILSIFTLSHNISLLQLTACVLWFSAIALAVARHKVLPCSVRTFLLGTGSALFLQVLFHSVYDTFEAYMFSAHTWPLVVLSGIILIDFTINEYTKAYYGKIIFILLFVSVLLSAIQTLSVITISF